MSVEDPRDKYLLNHKQSNMQEQYWGTLYPYLTTSKGMLHDMKRAISPFNPLALPQVPTPQRSALGIRSSNTFYIADPYPNAIHFAKVFPTHYDPLKEIRRKETSMMLQESAPDSYSIYGLKVDSPPKGCQVELKKYQRCLMVNNGVQSCTDQMVNIMEICPNFALDEIKETNRKRLKILAIANNKYREVMQVSSYNEGRTPADVSTKTWIHGTSKYLRPNTMYADERYVKVTQQEINEAKERVKQKGISKVDVVIDEPIIKGKKYIPLYP